MILNKNQKEYISNVMEDKEKYFSKSVHKTLQRKIPLVAKELQTLAMYLSIYGDINDVHGIIDITDELRGIAQIGLMERD